MFINKINYLRKRFFYLRKILFSNEVNFDSGAGEFYFQPNLVLHDGFYFGNEGSGIYSIGFELISPTGDIESITFIGNEMNTQFQGSLSNYVVESWIFTGDNAGGSAQLMLPASEFELGTYQFRFIATDYAGNQLITEDGQIPVSFESGEIIYVDYNPEVEFTSNNVNTTINPFDDYVILTWDWGYGDNIIVNGIYIHDFTIRNLRYVLDFNFSPVS